jgi:hypothetical protein
MLASILSTIKGLFGIKEEEPKQEYRPRGPRRRRPRRCKNQNQGNRPHRQTKDGQKPHGKGTGDEDQEAGKKRRRRRRRRNRRPQQAGQSSDAPAKPDSKPKEAS